MMPLVRAEREEASKVSRMRMPATARMMPITSRRRSGESRSHKDGAGRAGGLALACFREDRALLPLRLLLPRVNGLRRDIVIGRESLLSGPEKQDKKDETKMIIAQMVCLPFRVQLRGLRAA